MLPNPQVREVDRLALVLMARLGVGIAEAYQMALDGPAEPEAAAVREEQAELFPMAA